MKIAFLSNPSKKDASGIVKMLLAECAKKKHVEFLVDENLAKSLHRKDLYQSDELMSRSADLLVVLGGDGTLLNAVKRVPKAGLPIIGVNMGGMGFLSEFTEEDFLASFPRILKGDYMIDERMMLKVVLNQGGKKSLPFEALNDAVITKGALSRMLSLDVSVDGITLTTYKADGMIISTPTGSTAHSLSSGGPIVVPNCQAMIITPICPHTLSNRPLVISSAQTVRIQLASSSEMVGLTLDGQVGFEMKLGDWMEVSRAPRTIPLVRFEYDYFEILRKKLGWRGASI